MNNLKNNEQFNFLSIIFITVSIIHIFLAAITLRGLYEDGAFFMLELLNNFSDSTYHISADLAGHPRFCISLLMQLPLVFSHFVLSVFDKNTLMIIYSASLFILPLLALYWNYKLTLRSKRIDIFFWSLFIYCAIGITYSIFSVVETIIGAILHFILWNYIVADIDYKKRDIAGIIFLLIMMFGTYEYVSILGIIFFIASSFYLLKSDTLKKQAVKLMIGLGSLAASVFNIVFMLKVPGEDGEIMRFLKEAHDFLPFVFNLNISLSIITIIILLILFFKKTQNSIYITIFISFVYCLMFIKLLLNTNLSVYPMWEQHLRTIPCWLVPIIFTGLYIFDRFDQKINNVKFINYICIILICGIFQTLWQIVDTYWWDKNIQYLKKELENCNSSLYIPSEHEEISSFHNADLRRYIWHGVYSATSILLSKDYKLKTLLVNYDEQQDEGNGNYRNTLYVVPDRENTISIPYGTFIKIKNKYWDLSDCANALDKYNKENNIKTNQ